MNVVAFFSVSAFTPHWYLLISG